MTAWTDAVAAKIDELAQAINLPAHLKDHAGLEAIAMLETCAARRLACRLTPNSTGARVTVVGLAGPDTIAQWLLNAFSEAVSAEALGNWPRGYWTDTPRADAIDTLKRSFIRDLVLETIRHDLPDTARETLLRTAAKAQQNLYPTLAKAAPRHRRALIARDSPALLATEHCLTKDERNWVLACDCVGPSRAERVARRTQAFTLFASVSELLRTDEVTRHIDCGKPLLPLLARHLNLTLPQTQALREARPLDADQDPASLQFLLAVRDLRAHEVPLHEWPAGGKPAQADAWKRSPWIKNSISAVPLIRNDYLGPDAAQTKDAVAAFEQDLLAPLILSLATPARHKAFFAAIDLMPDSYEDMSDVAANLPRATRYLHAIHRALIGPRKSKAFQEAVALWHRRAAAVAALRHERQTNRPGWPALCAPWTSGAYAIVPLTTAQALVDEGNAHQHCVGGYYNTCRRGDTQILSLHHEGCRIATIEILLGSDLKCPSLRIGQFKGAGDRVPNDPAHHDALRVFLNALRTGQHPLNLNELERYRRRAAEHYEYHMPQILPLDHARQAFPLYLPLLPRGSPDTYDAWCDSSGLKTAIATILQELPHEPNADAPHYTRGLDADAIARLANARARELIDKLERIANTTG